MKWLIAALGLFGSALAIQAAQVGPSKPTHAIDLTAPAPAPTGPAVPENEQLRMPFGPQGFVSHQPLPVQRLSLQVLGLDRSSYDIGDPVVYRLLVSNISQKPFAFPASVAGDRFSRDEPNPTGGFLCLELKDPMLGYQIVGTYPLYGAPRVPGSLVLLQPGETLEIRGAGTWFLMSGFPQRPPATWSRPLQVYGSIHLFSDDEAIPSLRSNNAVAIQLTKK
jgi:hypothetical protein